MTLPARFGKKAGGVTKKDIEYLKNIYFKDVIINIVSRVFSGNGPYPPETAEYKALTGSVIRGVRLLRKAGIDVDGMIPGEETALETLKHFLYNDRTGDDDSIIIDMEK